tara:strand:+ start:2465 stop:2683 length:219 start_codon:yes stop_codon:yes gene_type:complete
MRRFIAYLRKLIESRSKESSKRFIALMIMPLVYYAVLRYTNEDNVHLILVELLGFILVLCGVAVYENIKRNR